MDIEYRALIELKGHAKAITALEAVHKARDVIRLLVDTSDLEFPFDENAKLSSIARELYRFIEGIEDQDQLGMFCWTQMGSCYNSINQSSYCPKCSAIKRGIAKRNTPEDYHSLAESRGLEWLGPEVGNAHARTNWQCEDGHIFEAAFNWGSGCPSCRESKGEARVALVLDSMRVPYERQKCFATCKGKRRVLPFDFYINSASKRCLIEYQGRQHYEPVDAFGGEQAFAATQETDKIKARFAKEHNYQLVVIHYSDFDNIDLIIGKEVCSETH